jgi:hypothetical protein
MARKKGSKTVRVKNSISHSFILYTHKKAWELFDELIEKENIPSRTKAFHILMINAIKEGRII